MVASQYGRPKEYIPFPLRLPVLLLFALVLCGTIGGLEYLARPSTPLRNYSMAHAVLQKRQADVDGDVPAHRREQPNNAPFKESFNIKREIIIDEDEEDPTVTSPPSEVPPSEAPPKEVFNSGKDIAAEETAPPKEVFNNGKDIPAGETSPPKEVFNNNNNNNGGSNIAAVDHGPTPTPTLVVKTSFYRITQPVAATAASSQVVTSNGVVQTVAVAPTPTPLAIPSVPKGATLLTSTEYDSAGIPTATYTGVQLTTTELSSVDGPISGPVSEAPPPRSSFLQGINRYFFGQYMLTVVAVLLAFLWRIIDTDIKRMAPFYQLSSAAGISGAGLAAPSLLLTSSYSAPLVAAYRGNWSAAISALILCPGFVIVQLLSPVAIFLNAEGTCGAYDENRNCSMRLGKRITALRALEGVLAIIVLLILVLAFLQHFQQRSSSSSSSSRSSSSKLCAEPWSIAGLATLVTEPRALAVFDAVDAATSNADLRNRLKHCRFALTTTTTTTTTTTASLNDDGSGKLYLTTIDAPPDLTVFEKPSGIANWGLLTRPPRVSRPPMLSTPVLSLYFTFLLGTLLLILTYHFGTIHTLDLWMASQSVGVRMFAIALGLVIRSFWEPIEREVRALAPFRRLATRHQQAAILTVDYTRAIPIWSEIEALRHGDVFVAFVGIIGLAVEAMVILLGAVPYASTLMFRDYQLATFFSAVVLVLMLVAVAAAWWRRRKKPCLPRGPWSVASLVAYVHAARMGEVLGGLTRCETRVRNKALVEGLGLASGGAGVGFGWSRGVDGVVRAGIDMEGEGGMVGAYEY